MADALAYRQTILRRETYTRGPPPELAGIPSCFVYISAGLFFTAAAFIAQPYVSHRAAQPTAIVSNAVHGCAVPAISLGRFANVLQRARLVSSNVTNARLLEGTDEEFYPRETMRALRMLAEFVRRQSTCLPGQSPTLVCTDHEASMGIELALISEAVRRASVLRHPRLCSWTFLSLDRIRMRNSAGALIQVMGTAQERAEVQLAALGVPNDAVLVSNTFVFPSTFFGGARYLHMLFGYSFVRPCVAEIEHACNMEDLARNHTTMFTKSIFVPPATTPSKELRALRPPRIFAARVQRSDPSLEHDLDALHADVFSRMYQRARRILPIVDPFAQTDGGKPVVNVVMHVRAGSGTKNAPERAFMPVLDLLSDSITEGATAGLCSLHVHVLHEYKDDRCCNGTLEWASARASLQKKGHPNATRTRVFLHIAPNRFSMFHTMWRAHFLVASRSKLPRVVGQLSPEIVAFTDGEIYRPRALIRARHIAWAPCGNGSTGKHFMEECASKISLGIAERDAQYLRQAARRLCNKNQKVLL